MPRQLKVYRTPIGFHDAYVAAPSQKAALEAWGSDANLFTRGVAEVVTDPALTRDPLASPGTVVRRLRGTADEHFAALPKAKLKAKPKAPPKAEAAAAAIPTPPKPPARATKPRPRPSRAALDAAEEAIVVAERQHGEERAALRRREQELTRERRAVERRQARETARLEEQRDRARKAHDRALAKWSR